MTYQDLIEFLENKMGFSHIDRPLVIKSLMLYNRLKASDSTITGFNVGMNCGESAGQTIFHVHIHLIPRRDGDTPNPTGGVRGVIPDKMCYCLKD